MRYSRKAHSEIPERKGMLKLEFNKNKPPSGRMPGGWLVFEFR